MEKRYVGKDGSPIWVNLTVALVRDLAGQPDYLISVIEDIAERKQAQDRERLLSREIDHRAKNLLMVVQSIVHLSGGTSIDEFKESVVGRIQALARAHGLLAASRWNAVALRSLVDEELEPYASSADCVASNGPDVNLKPAAAQSLGMVIHELATNAAKYGALSVPAGRVTVSWQVKQRGGEARLLLQWRERNGPAVSKPTRLGFGSTLIKSALAGEPEASVTLDFDPDGVQCRIELPLVPRRADGGLSPAGGVESHDDPARDPHDGRTPPPAGCPGRGKRRVS
jgi:two-component sensor histidine kinase